MKWRMIAVKINPRRKRQTVCQTLRFWWFVAALLFSGGCLQAQSLDVTIYQVRVLTKEGRHYKGPLSDIDSSYLYIRDRRWGNVVPLASIKKVVLRRESKKPVQLSGAIVGGLITGYLATKTPYRSPSLHVVTVTFAAAGGAAAGLLLSSAISSFVVSRRVIRPLNPANPANSLFRQLEPFCERHQNNFIDRLPPETR